MLLQNEWGGDAGTAMSGSISAIPAISASDSPIECTAEVTD
jgi:hypothetical protein